jgi:hypothetical protein
VRSVSERTPVALVDHVFVNVDGGNLNVSGMEEDNDFPSQRRYTKEMHADAVVAEVSFSYDLPTHKPSLLRVTTIEVLVWRS